jgi:hypothetical protein
MPGSGQTVEVELDDGDMADVEGWDAMALSEKWKTMTVRADTLVIEYMLRNGHISQEYAQQRIRELRSA